MRKLTENEKIIDHDILRYKKNKLAANLVLLALVFYCLYFMLLFGIKTSTVSAEDGSTTATKFASLQMGFTVILTLATLLVSFLASEGIKGYNKKYSIVLIVLAVLQVVRIFGYPLYGLQNNLLTVNYFGLNPTTSTVEFILLLVYLLASAACYIAAAVIGYVRAVNLEKFEKKISEGEVDVEKALDELDKQDASNVTASVAAEEEVV